MDAAGNIYTTVGTAIIRMKLSGEVTLLAGDSAVAGFADGTGSAARFSNMSAIAVDDAGNVFVADTGNHLVRKVTSAGVVTTIAGQPGVPGVKLGTLPGGLTKPAGIAVSPDGKVIFVTTELAVVRIQL